MDAQALVELTARALALGSVILVFLALGFLIYFLPRVIEYSSEDDHAQVDTCPHTEPAHVKISPSGAICPVCGESVGDAPAIQCGRCQTPHHRDCWDWCGKSCAIYGCK